MTTPPTADRQALADAVKERLWRYLAGHAAPISLAPAIEDLFRLRRGEIRRLAATHLALSPATDAMLAAAERLLRELPSSITRTETDADGAIRPPIAWHATLLERRRGGARTAFVTRPPERQYDTSLARLLKLALTQCSRLSELAALGADGAVALSVEERSQRALRLLRHVKLEDVRLTKTVPASTARLAARHLASAVPAFSARYADAINNQAPSAIREVVSEQLLAPAEIDRLFELYVGFELLDGLIAIGFEDTSARLIPGHKLPLASARRGPITLEIWWQKPIWGLLPKHHNKESHYRKALIDAEISNPQPLRPDLLVTDTARQHLLIVEAKFTGIEGHTPQRRGILDALAYLKDASTIVATRPLPHALVAAWDASGKPASTEIVVASQSDVRAAIALIIDQWLKDRPG